MMISTVKKTVFVFIIAASILFGITISASAKEDLTASAQTEASQNDKTTEDEFAYADKLFDTSRLHVINIEISESDWEEILSKPLGKPKVYVTAVIDGETYENVRFSPKGNASLFIVASNTSSERYSFKLKFNTEDENSTYHGLDQLVLNNSFGDPSYLRDYACACLFQQQGVPIALMSFTRLYINGKFYGVYMAAESESESFVNRVFGGEGTFYKPESAVLEERDDMVIEQIQEALDNGSIEEFMKNFQMFSMPPDYETTGADLKYTDDDPDSYIDITQNNVTDIDDEAVLRLIAALKNLSLGNTEEAVDENEVIRYFAVHNFVCNSDSYTSIMLHNYMLYENNGILSMIPWDYNASMMPTRIVTGGTDKNSWDEIINMGLDSPTYQEVSLDDRPMLAWIFENDDTYAEYENITGDIIDYIQSGDFEKEMQRIYEQIRPYVILDPTAFYTLEEFDASYQDVISFCKLRAESLRKQLDGDLAKVTADQNTDDRVTLYME